MLGLLARSRRGASCSFRYFCSGVLPDGLDRTSQAFSRNSEIMTALLSQLQSRIAKVYIYFHIYLHICVVIEIIQFNNGGALFILNIKVMEGGGAETVERNKSRNKLLPRDRINHILDPGSSFLELSQVLYLF